MPIVYNCVPSMVCLVSGKGDMRKLVHSAIKRGWRDITGERKRKSIHYVLEWIDGTRVYASATPSCSHAVKNCAADLARVERKALTYTRSNLTRV